MNIKKIFFALISFVLFLATPGLASAATLSLSPPTGSLNKGCEYTLIIELDTLNAQTDGTDAILTYEPSKLTLAATDITNGKIYADYPGNSVDPQAGKISISGIASVSQGYGGKGTFASFKVKVPNTASGTTSIKFDYDPNDKTKTTDTNVVERGTIADILTQVTDGIYTIGTGACGAIGTATATPAGGAGGAGAPGDALTTLPVGDTTATTSTIPVKSLPAGGILDNTVVAASVGFLLVVLGIAGIAFL